MNKWLAVVAFVMLVLAGAVGLRNALAHAGNQPMMAASGSAPAMQAMDGCKPVPPTPW